MTDCTLNRITFASSDGMSTRLVTGQSVVTFVNRTWSLQAFVEMPLETSVRALYFIEYITGDVFMLRTSVALAVMAMTTRRVP